MNAGKPTLDIFFSPKSMENKLLFWDYLYTRNKTHHPTVKNLNFITTVLRRRGEKEEEKKKNNDSWKKHKRKPSVKIAPETLQNCNGFLLLKLIGVAML